MLLHEAVMRMQERPELLAWLPGRRIVFLSGTGYIMRTNDKGKPAYCFLTAQDLIAIGWQVYTQEQLGQILAQAEAQAQQG